MKIKTALTKFILLIAIVPGNIKGQTIPIHGFFLDKTGLYSRNGDLELQRNAVYLSYITPTNLQLRVDLRGRYQARLTPNPEYEFDFRWLTLGQHYQRWSWLFGRQLITWGKADGFRLLDVVNPYDYTEFVLDELDQAKRPLTILRIDYSINDCHCLQLLIIPENRGDLLPPPNSQFNPFPPGLPWLEPDKVNKPNNFAIHNWQYGVCYDYTGEKLSYSLNYLYKWSDQPLYTINPWPLYVIANSVREQIFGASTDVPFGSYVFRSETVFLPKKQIPTFSQLGELDYKSSCSLGTVLAVDKIINNWFLSIQFLYARLINNKFDPIYGPTQKVFTFLTTYCFAQDTMKFKLFTAYDEVKRGLWIAPYLTWDVGKGLEVTLGFDGFTGSQTSLFGRYKKNSRFFLSLKWCI
jgi:hypothetical protein